MKLGIPGAFAFGIPSAPLDISRAPLRIHAVSEKARRFPDERVEFRDLLGTPYRRGAHGGGGALDCAGLAIEIFRRAGVGFSQVPGPSQGFEIFDRVQYPERRFDVALLRDPKMNGEGHVAVIVGFGLLQCGFMKPEVTHHKVDFVLRHPLLKKWKPFFLRISPAAIEYLHTAPIEEFDRKTAAGPCPGAAGTPLDAIWIPLLISLILPE